MTKDNWYDSVGSIVYVTAGIFNSNPSYNTIVDLKGELLYAIGQ